MNPSPINDSRFTIGEGVAADDEVFDFLAVGQVFVDDAFEVFGVEAAVPGAFGVDDGDGAVFADAKAADLRAVEAATVRRAVDAGGGFLELAPGAVAFLGGTAIGADAEEDVALVLADAPFFGSSADSFEISHGGSVGERGKRKEERGSVGGGLLWRFAGAGSPQIY